MNRLQAFTSDWHLLEDGRVEPCDRELVKRFVTFCIEEKIRQVTFGGDIFDKTRGINDEAYKWFVENVLNPLRVAEIYSRFMHGNHEGDINKWNEILKKLFDLGADPKWFCAILNPIIQEGKVTLTHGHPFDAWCSDHGSFRTMVGEIFTRLDHVIDHVGIDIEKVNPTLIYRCDCIELDPPIHNKANKYAAQRNTMLLFGHSHRQYSLFGETWEAHNSGALTKGHKLEFLLFDENDGYVERVSE